MTTLTVKGGQSVATNLDAMDFGLIESEGSVVSHTARKVVVSVGAGISFTFVGEGFGGYDGRGWPTEGTLTEIYASTLGNKVLSISGFDPVDIALWRSLAETHDSRAFVDLLFGGEDELSGGSAGDVLYGWTGSDTIDGGGGGDRLNGGAGQDVLRGRLGNDTFEFSAAADSTARAADRITDLNAGDQIDLSKIDADRGTVGDQAFLLVQAFSGAAGELVISYDADKNRTRFEGDTDGDGKANLVFTANGDHSGFGDFLL